MRAGPPVSPTRPTGDVLGRGFAFPVQLDAHGRPAMVSDELDVAQAILLILATAPGERPMRPEFGCDVQAFVFERVTPSTLAHIERAVRQALDRWEPRISVEEITFRTDDDEYLGALFIDVGYTLRATNSRRNLVYPFYLVPAESPA